MYWKQTRYAELLKRPSAPAGWDTHLATHPADWTGAALSAKQPACYRRGQGCWFPEEMERRNESRGSEKVGRFLLGLGQRLFCARVTTSRIVHPSTDLCRDPDGQPL